MDHNLLVAARSEYTEKLMDILKEGIHQCIDDIWKECKKDHFRNTLSNFQKKLCVIPKWNQEVINDLCSKITSSKDTSLEYLDKIIEAVFLSNIKILSVVKLNDDKQTIDVNVPDTKNFIHRCCIETARKFYVDPYLIDDRETSSNTQQEMKKNVKRIDSVIKDSIEKTIRGMIPMEDILKKYLDQTVQASEPIQQAEEVEQIESEEHDYQPTEEQDENETQPVENVQTVDDIFQEEPHETGESKSIETPNIEKLHIDLSEQPSNFFSDSD